MKKFIIAVIAISACAAGGAVLAQQTRMAGPGQESGNVCLQYNRLSRWSVVNSTTLSVIDKTEKHYRVGLSSDCAHSSFVDRVVFQRLGKPGLDCVQPGDRVRLLQAGRPPEVCLVSNVSYYTEAQQKADAKVNPSKP